MAMKMTDEDYNELLAMCRDAHKDADLSLERRHYTASGLSEMRFRWDVLWGVPAEKRTPWFDRVYKYLNDDHIDTALKRVITTLLNA